jgi:hypothetical protein
MVFQMSEQRTSEDLVAAYLEAMEAYDIPSELLEVYDSCSWRRVGLKGKYETVMQPVIASDGHPDITGGAVLRAMVAAYNAMPAVLARLNELEGKRG